jgi:phosphomannomutase/phosphoglucomutase
MSFKINPSVFREYDIRGIAGSDLSEEFAERLGLAYAVYISEKIATSKKRGQLTVSVGHDCRLSSPSYAEALIAGLNKGNIKVVHLGNCPTPATYFSLFHLNLDGAIMITASHLPADHNGFKVCLGRNAIYGDQIQELRHLMESDSKPISSTHSSNHDSVLKYAIIPPYLDFLLKGITPKKPRRIVIDCGNGNGSQVVPQLFKKLGAEVTELFCEMDGRFPNHTPDPSNPKNLVELIAKVKETRADFGIGIDGDADRIGVVDENGKLLYGDELLVIYSRDILKDHPGATVVSEVKSSFKLFDDIKKHGGNPIMWKTGHSLIEAKMKETKALLGGEMSGHMFFADKYLGYDDAPYAALRIYDIAAQHGAVHSEPFSSLLSGLPKTFSTPEIRVTCDDKTKFEIIKKIEKELCSNAELAKNKITTIDGIRIDFKDGWGLIRASNTEPVLSLRFEATSQSRLEEIKKIFEDALADSQAAFKPEAAEASVKHA